MEELYKLAKEALADHAHAAPPPWDVEVQNPYHDEDMYVVLTDERNKSVADNMNADLKTVLRDGSAYTDPEGMVNLGFCARARDREHRLAKLLTEIAEAGPSRDCRVTQPRTGAWFVKLDGLSLSWNRQGVLQIVNTLLRAIEEE